MLRTWKLVWNGDSSTNRRALLAALLLSGTSTVVSAQTASNGEGPYSPPSNWQIRDGKSVVPTHFGSSDEPRTRFTEAESQFGSSQLKWVSTSSVPTSPWDKPSNRDQAQTSSPQSSTPSVRENVTSQEPYSSSVHSMNSTRATIRQPSTSPQSVDLQADLNAYAASNAAMMGSIRSISQPSNHSEASPNYVPNSSASNTFSSQQVPAQATQAKAPGQYMKPATDVAAFDGMPFTSAQSQPSMPAVHAPQTPYEYRYVQQPPLSTATPDFAATTPSSVVGVVPGQVVGYTRQPVAAAPVQATTNSPNSSMPIATQVVVQATREEQEILDARRRLASRISQELLRDGNASPNIAPRPVEAPTGWKTIEEELQAKLAKCEELLRRNAVLSAKQEVISAIRTLMRAIDLRAGRWTSEPAFDEALVAIEEEGDFHLSSQSTNSSSSTATLVAKHATRVLKQVDLASVSPELASQHYRGYAAQQLIVAAQGHPWASDLYYALGKALEREGELNRSMSRMRHGQAVACYQAALQITPNHSGSAIQLGYSLLKLDRVDEALPVLQQTVQVAPTVEAWRNLAEAYRRRGQQKEMNHAQNQVAMLTPPSTANRVPDVIQVDPNTFAGISPRQYVSGPTSMVTQANTSGMPISPAENASWFQRLWR